MREIGESRCCVGEVEVRARGDEHEDEEEAKKKKD